MTMVDNPDAISVGLALARQLYEEAEQPPLDKDILSTAVLKVAMDTFQKANNPNKTQGGIKQSLDMYVILHHISPPSSFV